MALITLPQSPPLWRDATFRLRRADAALQFASGATQVTAYSLALWSATIIMPPMERGSAVGAAWRGALAQLSALENTFEASPPEWSGLHSAYAGPAPLVAGADQAGKSLIIDGATASATIFLPGDYFHVVAGGAKELKIVTQACTANGSGQAVVSFEPALRAAPADNAPLAIASPVCAFGLVNPEAAWDMDVNGFLGMSLDFIERFAPASE